MNRKKENSFAWNETIQKLTAESKSVQERSIRIDLTDEEIERLLSGEVIQTQYSWLKIGRSIGR